MPRRRVRSTASASSTSSTGASRPSTGGRRRKLASAATLLPLAIGLANTNPRPAATPSTTTAGAAIAISCTLPFDAPSQHHPIDDTCGPDGNSPANSARALQNELKNNFCAQGNPVDLTFPDFRQLQEEAATKVSFGSDSKLPQDRSPLRSLSISAGTVGEGSVVRVVAYIMDAHYSNLGKGESVNCNQGDPSSNDIHIVLQEHPTDQNACSSITAEMSPHFRPDPWNPNVLDVNSIKKSQTPRLFRFTGQLFFDASHRPCTGSTGPGPQRSSLWEIHPVYQVEVCSAQAADCTVDNDANWQPLDSGAGAVSSTETRLRLPRTSQPADQAGGIRPGAIVPEL